MAAAVDAAEKLQALDAKGGGKGVERGHWRQGGGTTAAPGNAGAAETVADAAAVRCDWLGKPPSAAPEQVCKMMQ